MEKKEYFCDFCKRQIRTWRDVKLLVLGHRVRDAEKRYDMCEECDERLREFIKKLQT